jgi:hypothetical protein
MEEVYPQKNKKVTTSEKKVVTWEKNQKFIRKILRKKGVEKKSLTSFLFRIIIHINENNIHMSEGYAI